MHVLESSRHLFQRPKYAASKTGDLGTSSISGEARITTDTAQKWRGEFRQVISDAPDSVTWDPGAILSVLSYGFACGNRTLLQEIKRQPWLSRLESNGRVLLEDPPPHLTHKADPSLIADGLVKRLHLEIVAACRERQEIYVLLSGGLDSRIVASVASRAYEIGDITARPVAVTWGRLDSRDVHYAREAAKALRLPWEHVLLSSDILLPNVELTALHLGALISPVHLHGMAWFKRVSPDAMVLAASYGDSVGRAEYSMRSLLELSPLVVPNSHDLLLPTASSRGADAIRSDLHELRQRTPAAPRYVVCEHEMMAHYMRGLIGHAMSTIDSYCALYQVFTDPSVYSYMWALHPSIRTDAIYAHILEKVNERVARLPWARSNRALRGPTHGADKHLSQRFHDYRRWLQTEAYNTLAHLVDPHWFAETQMFRASAVESLVATVCSGRASFRECEVFAWLASLRRLGRLLEDSGKTLQISGDIHTTPILPSRMTGSTSSFRVLSRTLRRSRLLLKVVRALRRRAVRVHAAIRYRVVPGPP